MTEARDDPAGPDGPPRSGGGRARAAVLWVAPLAVLAGSLAVTWFLWRSSSEEVRRSVEAYFEFRVRETGTRVEQRMDAYEQVLRGVVGLFAASVSVERDEFRAYAGTLRLQAHYPGIQGIGYAQIVPAAGRERHVAATRAEGIPWHEMRPPGERPFYTTVVYLEPFSGRNLRAVGFDMYSEPVRRAAMERARDGGSAAVTGKVRLVQETDTSVQAGFLMVLPVFRKGAPAGSVAERRESILGWVYAPFRMDDLMAGILGERAKEVAIEIFDGETVLPQARMTASDRVPAAYAAAPAFTAIRRLEIAGRAWTLVVRSLPPLDARREGERPRFIAATGAGASAFLALVAWLLARDKGRTLRSAREVRTAREELEAANEKLRGANEELAELASHDRLTGAWNRHQFEAASLLEMERTRRSGRPLSLILMDVDHFKSVNDRHGHQAGDRVLAGVSLLVRESIRSIDSLTRWGGEEFIVEAPYSSSADAATLAEKLRKAIAERAFPEVGGVTVSCGVAEFLAGDTLDDWIGRADMALYEAKAAGRNTVRPPPPGGGAPGGSPG